MPRQYEQKRRAATQAETRGRIVRAAVALHGSIGPARTTVSAVAERARVQRLTVYRHFPDETSLLVACIAHEMGADPPPDPRGWTTIRDPRARLRTALGELYAYYERNARTLENVERDAQVLPALAKLMTARAATLVAAAGILAVGWSRGRPGRRLGAAIGHALEFGTWSSLQRRQGLDRGTTIDLMVLLVTAAGSP